MRRTGESPGAVVVALHNGPLAGLVRDEIERRTGWSVALHPIRDQVGPGLVADLDRLNLHSESRILLGRPSGGLWQAVVALALTRHATGPARVLAVLPGLEQGPLLDLAVESVPQPLNVEELGRRLLDGTASLPGTSSAEVRSARRLLRLNWHSLGSSLRRTSGAAEDERFTEFVRELPEAPRVWRLVGPLGPALVAAARGCEAREVVEPGEENPSYPPQQVSAVCTSIYERFWR